MKNSAALDLAPQLPFNDGPNDEIQRRFEKFHADNPHIYKFLVRFTREVVDERRHRGLSPNYGIAAALERVRWHVNVEVRGYPEFKLNNNYRSRYARLIQLQEHDLANVYELRELTAVRGIDYPSVLKVVNEKSR